MSDYAALSTSRNYVAYQATKLQAGKLVKEIEVRQETYDLIVRGGTVVDGALYPRRVADIGVRDGVISKIGNLEGARAAQTIDAKGLIVAPGVIDIHTHYDAQIHWDPLCTSSSFHGATTIGIGNCGFGYAPCKPADRDRYMLMMVNSEQIPLEAQKAGIPWQWETFPEWLDHLRRIPKGLNIVNLLPLNPLLLYVMGEECKTRHATRSELQRMRDILNEAMDAGAGGFGVSILGHGSGHVDFDGSPVPTDLMDPEEAYALAEVLRERDQGVIQAAVEIRLQVRRDISENLARISGRPVIHNAITPADEPEGIYATPEAIAISNRWRETLAWVDEMEAKGLNIFIQGITARQFLEIKIEDFSLFSPLPVLKEIHLAKGSAAKAELLRNEAWRQRARDAYSPLELVIVGGGVDRYILSDAQGASEYAPYTGKRLAEIAVAQNKPVIDVFFDILLATHMEADFRITDIGMRNPAKVEELVRHRRVIPGAGDGGAHVKMMSQGFWPIDMITWLVRDEKRLTIEEMHNILSLRGAHALDIKGRGALLEGYAADLMIYDFNTLGYPDHYETLTDLPGGGWRRMIEPSGVHWVITNGEIILDHGRQMAARPGQLLGVDRRLSTGRPKRVA